MSKPRPRHQAAPDPFLVIDRIEGDLVVVELPDRTTVDLPRWMLPDAVREGDVIRATSSGSGTTKRIVLEVDPAETASRKSASQATIERLRARDPGGDIQL